MTDAYSGQSVGQSEQEEEWRRFIGLNLQVTNINSHALLISGNGLQKPER